MPLRSLAPVVERNGSILLGTSVVECRLRSLAPDVDCSASRAYLHASEPTFQRTQFFSEHLSSGQERLVAVQAGSAADELQHAVADISQTVGRGSIQVNGCLSTVQTSTRLWSFKLHRFATPAELVAVHGFEQYDFATVPWETAMSVVGNMQTATHLVFALIPVLEALGHLQR